MISKPLSVSRKKFLKRLGNRKFRHEQGLFLAEGNTLVSDLLRVGMQPESLYVASESDYHLFPQAEWIDAADRKYFSNFDNPAGAAAVFSMPAPASIDEISEVSFVPALFAVQDPGNLGTILRSASWFGFPYVILLEGCTDAFNPKTIQASMGAIAQVKLVHTTLDNLAQLPHVLLGAHMEGHSLYTFDFPEQSILLLGNEGAGLPMVDFVPVSIPKAKNSKMESLNVAMAAGIAMSIVYGNQ
jgi:TrmH family RNA methyltransferase